MSQLVPDLPEDLICQVVRRAHSVADLLTMLRVNSRWRARSRHAAAERWKHFLPLRFPRVRGILRALLPHADSAPTPFAEARDDIWRRLYRDQLELESSLSRREVGQAPAAAAAGTVFQVVCPELTADRTLRIALPDGRAFDVTEPDGVSDGEPFWVGPFAAPLPAFSESFIEGLRRLDLEGLTALGNAAVQHLRVNYVFTVELYLNHAHSPTTSPCVPSALFSWTGSLQSADAHPTSQDQVWLGFLWDAERMPRLPKVLDAITLYFNVPRQEGDHGYERMAAARSSYERRLGLRIVVSKSSREGVQTLSLLDAQGAQGPDDGFPFWDFGGATLSLGGDNCAAYIEGIRWPHSTSTAEPFDSAIYEDVQPILLKEYLGEIAQWRPLT